MPAYAPIPAPPPRTAPTIPPYRTPAPFTYTPPVPGGFTGAPPTSKPFTGQAPTSTPMAGFVGPDASNFQTDPSYQWRLSQGLKGVERGAAARGTLLTGGTQKALTDYGQHAASQEYGNAYQRALDAYGTNRNTNAQNFGQAMQGYQAERDTNAQNFSQDQTRYQDALAGYKANTDTTLAAGAQGLQAATAGYDRNAAASDRAQDWNAEDAFRRNDVANANNATTYQTQMLEYQRQQRLDDQRQQQFAANPANGMNGSFSPDHVRPFVAPLTQDDTRLAREAEQQRQAQGQVSQQQDLQRQQQAFEEARMRQYREEFEARLREEAARKNAATAAIPPQAAARFKPWVGAGR